MFNRIHNLLDSAVSFVRARRTDKIVTGVNVKPSDYLCADAVDLASSPFDVGELPGCHAGSFNAVLRRLFDWVKTDPAPVLWLTGPANSGKTAVARSLVTRWKSEDRFAACFLVNGNSNSIKSLIPTLACQIAPAIPEFQSQLARVADDDNPIGFKQSLQSQFEKFILNPILQANLSPTRRRASLPILIVVDGLDECDDQRERCLFLKTVLEAAPRLRRSLKFLVVSRPKADIRNSFESTSVQDDINIIDLSTYLIHTKESLPKRIGGLERTLHNSDHDIDTLFHNVLSSSGTTQSTMVLFLSVVLVCLQVDMSPLTPFSDIPASLTQSDRFMESILDLEPRSLQSALSDLKSLVSFRRKIIFEGHSFHDVRIIEFCHNSFKEFLVDQSRSREFHIDPKAACMTVAKGVLRLFVNKGGIEKSYWPAKDLELGCDPRPAYHNCLVWCYEHLTPDKNLQQAMMEYDPIDYLSSKRKNIKYPTAVALFTFTCKLLRRFEELPCTEISNHLRGRLDSYLKSELDYWVPHTSDLMRVLKASIFPDHIDWESFRSSEGLVKTDHEAISRRLDDPRVVKGHLPYFLTWIFDKGLGYAGSTVERTVCCFFYSEDRAGKYYFGPIR